MKMNALLILFFVLVSSCTGSVSSRLKEGSKPINQWEKIEYKKALIRCHKTGGTRIVKIRGQLRCF